MKYKLLRFSLLCILTMLCGGSVWADYYEKVTSTDELVTGDYLIVYEATSVAFNGGLETLDAASNTINVTISNSKIESSTTVDAAIFTIDMSAKTIKSASGKYIGISSYGNGLKTFDTGDAHDFITLNSDGSANIGKNFTNKGQAVTMNLRYNKTSGQNRFRYFKDAGQEAIHLYKRIASAADTRVETALSFGEGYTTTGLPETSIALPTAIVSTIVDGVSTGTLNDPTITWESSDPTVAEISGSNINLLKYGKATITATYAGNETQYKGSTASYEVTVCGQAEDGIFNFGMYQDYGSGAVVDANAYITESKTWTAGTVTLVTDGKYRWYTDGTLRIYNPDEGSTTLKISVPEGKVISQIVLTGSYFNDLTASSGTYNAGTWTGSAQEVTLTRGESNSQIKTITVSYQSADAPEAPTFSPVGGTYYGAQSITLTTATDGATIKYSTDGETYNDYTGAIAVSETTTITAYAEKDGEKSAEVSATYTIRPLYTTVAQLHENVTDDYTPIGFQPESAQVVYVNGKNGYLVDNAGNGVLIYNNSALKVNGETELAAGQVLTGGMICGSLVLYNGCTEITGFTTEGATISTAEVTPAEKTLPLTSANQSTLVTIKGVTYNSTDKVFSDGTNTIAYYDKFSASPTLEDGKTYDVTGIAVKYDNYIQLCPRTASDIVEATSETTGFRDIKANLTQLQELATGSNVYITVDAEGNIGTTDNAEEAAATLKGGWHGTQYGWTNFTATVPVQGCVKITYATHDYGQDVIVTNSADEQVAKFNTKGAKWSSDPNNVVVAYYRTNSPTILYFSSVNYNPYFAVEAIDEAVLPAEVTNYTVTYAAGEGTGVAPAAVEVEAGSKTTAPKNYSLYKEGYTLTGWSDGTTTYAPSDEITPEGDITLTAVYTQNEVSLADREDAVTITYALDGYNDNPKHNFQSGAGIIVTQATVNGKTIDVAVNTNGKFAHNGSGWHQVNANTTVTVPSCKGATFSVKTYEDANALKFGETAAESGATATYTATTDDATLVITQTANGYWNNLTITLPKVEQGGGEDPIINPGESDLMWDYTETAPTNNPDNGLYYGSKVNDATGTNLGLKGVKLNGSGYAFFAKNPVEGKLTLTISQRKSNGAYAVNVYACTIADGVATKGDIIGEIAVEEGPGTGSLDIPASVTGIYIERQTSSEGVLSKIVFKEKIARTFTDFEIPYATLKETGYTGAGLPTGVTFSGSFHDGQHGYNGATLVVPTDGGAVKFTISGCQYGNTFPVKNSANETLTTLDQKSPGCYDAGGIVTYIYSGDATTLTFGPIGYLAYFKAEAVEVTEATITYKNQNGTELGKKTVYEGDAIGESPYTEDDLTIASGYKFRGWTYTNGVKVKPTDIVDGSKSVLASVTEIEAEPTVGSIQSYDLTSNIFYPEDHENFDVENANYYNNHGFNFNAGGSFSVKVAGKAQVVLSLCQYGNGTTITVTDADNNVINAAVPAKAESDGATTIVNYDGGATTLTFTFVAQSYLHKVTVFNVNEFIEKDTDTGWYIVPANDGVGFVVAVNSASEGDHIFLPNGTYDLGTAALTTIGKNNISIVGESMEGVVIKNRPIKEGIAITATLLNTSTGLYMQDLTLDCVAPYGTGDDTSSAERGVTLQDKGTQTILKNVYLKGRQDTYYCNNNNGQYYFEDGKIEGTVDYICGNGDAYFNKVTLFNTDHHNPSTGNCITAPNTPKQYGYIFNKCTIDGVSAQDGKYSLGRPWAANTQVIYLNTTMKIQPLAAGWTDWSPANAVKQFAEYGSVDANGDPVDTSNRKTTFNGVTNAPTLNETQAAAFALETVFEGWNPAQYTEQVKTTQAKLNGKTLTWSAVDGATMYAIVKNGSIIDLTDQTSYTIADEAQGAKGLGTATNDPTAAGDTYAVRAANGRGGFGEAVVADDATGIDNITTDATGINGTITEVYSMGGARLAAPQKGVNIVKVKANDGSVKTVKVVIK